MSSTTMQIQEIYVGLLGRAADAEGLAYWKAEIDGGVLSIEELRANIVNEQPEYAANLGTLSRTDLVTELYDNLFNREPDDAGLAYWVTGGGSTVNADQLVLALVNGAAVADEAVLANRTEVANYYTDSGATYNEATAASVIAGVDATDASVQAAKSDISLLATATTSTLTEGGTYDYSSAGPVTLTISGDDDATDGDDFVVTGSKFNDTFAPTEYRNLEIDGGDGVDTLDMSDAAATVNALTGRATFTGKTPVTEFTDIEKFVFDDRDDTFTGGQASETIVGGGGADILTGGAGDDVFIYEDTDQLAESTTAAVGGLGTDTIQVGIKDDSTVGYAADLTSYTGTTTLAASGIEKLVVTGKEKDSDQVFASTVTVDTNDSDFTKFEGATANDKLVLESDAYADTDYSSFEFTNFKEVSVDAEGGNDVILSQDQLDDVARWLTTDNDSLKLESSTGVTSQTWDLTDYYFNGWKGLVDSGSVKATFVVDQATLAGFANDSDSNQYEITLDSGDTLQIQGAADISTSFHSVSSSTLSIDSSVTMKAADLADAKFDEVVATGDTASLAIEDGTTLVNIKFDGLKSLQASGSSTTTLDATTTGIDGLTLSTKGSVTFKDAGKSVAADYQSFDGLILAGSNTTALIDGAVALDQDSISQLKVLDGDDGTGDVLWVTSDLDLSSITSASPNNAVSVQDTSVGNTVTGFSDTGSYTFSKGGADTFIESGADDTVTVSSSSGSMTATMGKGEDDLTIGKSTGSTTDVTATFVQSDDGNDDVTVQSTNSGTIDLTFGSYSKVLAGATVVSLGGKGSQTVTFGDTLVGSDTDLDTIVNFTGSGAMSLTGGSGFFDVNLNGGSGATTIELIGDVGARIHVDNDDGTPGEANDSYSGNLDITVGDALGSVKEIKLEGATGVNTITTGKGGWTIIGGEGQDTITTGSGSDNITAGKGGDVIDISAGGNDVITLDSDGVAALSDASADGLSITDFTGYGSISGFGSSSTLAVGDRIQLDLTNVGDGESGLSVDSFGTNDIDSNDVAADNDDLYVYTGEVADLTDVAEVVSAIGTINGDDNDSFYVVINDDGGAVFGLYQVDLGSAFVDGDDFDDNDGNEIKLLGIVDGQVSEATATDFFAA